MSGHTKGQEEKAQTTLLRGLWGSMHVKQKIGLFEATNMTKCIVEIKRVEVETKRHGHSQDLETSSVGTF